MKDDETLSEASNNHINIDPVSLDSRKMDIDNNHAIRPIKRGCRGRFYVFRHGKNYFLLRMPCCRLERCVLSYILCISFYIFGFFVCGEKDFVSDENSFVKLLKIQYGIYVNEVE
jgi:hypothetical protein